MRRLLSVGTLGVLVFASACSEKEQSTVQSRRQLLVEASSFAVFQQAIESDAVLGASNSLLVGDGVDVLTTTGFASVTNSGSGETRIGSDAHVGDVLASGAVDLRDRATVHGTIYGSNVTQGNGAVISQGILAGLTVASDIVPPLLPYEHFGGDVRLEPNEILDLSPGHYGTLELKSGARLSLTEARYSFSTFMVHPGAVIEIDSDCEPAEVQVRNEFHFRGAIKEIGADDPGVPLRIMYEGTGTAHIESPFRGTFIGPNAELILNSTGHQGHFFAKILRVQAHATISAPLPYSDDPSCRPVAQPDSVAVIPADIGPAPTLQGPDDLDGFLSWYYRIRSGEVQEAKNAISAVGQSVSMVDGVIQRFEAARADRKIGEGLMLLSLLGSMNAPAAEAYLSNVAEELMPSVLDDAPDTAFNFSPFDREIAYRSKAMDVLASRPGAAGMSVVRNVALSSPERELRGRAIKVLAYGMSDTEKETLRQTVQQGDQLFVDRPNRSDSDFATKVATYSATYR